MRIWASALVALAPAILVTACSGQSGGSGIVPGGPQPSAAVRHFSTHTPQVQAMCPTVRPGYARCFALRRTDVWFAHPPKYRRVTNVAQADLASAASSGWFYPLGPQQLQQAYDLPSATAGTGQTVGIVDAYDDPTAESDLAAYRAYFKLPACTTANGCFRKLNQNGQSAPLPKANAGWAGEISLDLDMVSAICPNCHIVLIEATTNGFKDLGTAAKAAAAAGANTISNSYGAPECYINKKHKMICSSPAKWASYYNIPGTIVTASSGDSDWFAGPQSPADYGTVVAVGGTSIYPYNNKRGWIETAWTGAGSSCSVYVSRPSWIPKSTGCPNQAGKGPGTMRPIADVSAVADPFTGVLVYQTYPYSKGGFTVYGGTSVASPIIASVYALAGNAASQKFGAALYTAKKSLNDVVIGKNGIIGFPNDAGQQCTPVAICTAMPGWDGPTGNGTPWGVGAF